MLRQGTSACVDFWPVRRMPAIMQYRRHAATLKSTQPSKLNIVLDEDYQDPVTFDEAVLCFMRSKFFSSNPVCRELTVALASKGCHIMCGHDQLCFASFASAAGKFVQWRRECGCYLCFFFFRLQTKQQYTSRACKFSKFVITTS